MSEEYKMQRIKEYLIFHIKDSKEQRKLLDYLDQLQQKENIIKEVRDILKKYICNPSGLKDGWHIDCWNDKDISKLNEYLGILNKDR